MPQRILRPMIVDRDADVVLPDELLYSRQSSRCGIPGDNDLDTRSLAVFELGTDISIFILREIDGPGSVQPDARRGIVRHCSRFLLRVHRKMIFDVLGVQIEHIELLHEADHKRPAEVTECVAGQTQTNGRNFASGWGLVASFLCWYEDAA